MTGDASRVVRLMIVDDDPNIRALFSTIMGLSIPELAVDTAEDGAVAVSGFERDRHDVIIMDLHMPTMDGVRAFEEIRNRCGQNGWQMPDVIFCTGYAVPQVLNRILESDSRHTLLCKPVRASELVQRVREHMPA